MFVATFIIFNSYLDKIKTPVVNYTNYKLMTVRYDETFKNVFTMLDDNDLLKLKQKEEK